MTFKEYFQYFSMFNSWEEAIFTFTAMTLLCNIFVSLDIYKEKQKEKNEESNVYLILFLFNTIITILFIATLVCISI